MAVLINEVDQVRKAAIDAGFKLFDGDVQTLVDDFRQYVVREILKMEDEVDSEAV